MPDASTIGLVLSSSVFAATLTQAFNMARDWHGRKTRGKFSALHLSLELEAFGYQCSHNLSEVENFIASDGHHGSQLSPLPELPPHGETIDWKALGLATTIKVHRFRVAIERARASISATADYVGCEEAEAEALRSAASLGLRALDLADEISSEKSNVGADVEFNFDPRTHLAERKRQLELRHAAYLGSQRESLAHLTASTQR